MTRPLSLTCLAALTFAASAQDEPAQELAPTVVEAEANPLVQPPFLPEVDGTKIMAGKKTSVIDLDALPKIANNNYRQTLAKTPGLYLSEESTPLVSIGYRGLDPHRIQFTQVLKDGIPIHADQFGYPEAYYTPPTDTIDRIEFLRGGAALIYGPQPGGALNFVTHRPRTDRPFSFGTSHLFGTDDLYSTFTYFDGTSGPLGYYAYFNHREGDGFRKANSDFELNAGALKLVLGENSHSRWTLNLEGYEEKHGEPGGLTFERGAGRANYRDDRAASSRLHDRFELERFFASLQWEHDFSDRTKWLMSAWGGYYSRWSARQRGGGFGRLPSGADASTNTIEEQIFRTFGWEGRLRHDYEWLGGEHTISAGVQTYYSDSPREDRRGATPNARDGVLRNKSWRDVFYLPFFLENRFTWGPWSITPGVRLENFWQKVDEEVNADKTGRGTPLGESDEHEFVPLFGLGIAYELADQVEIYGNVAQSYRPKIYTQAVPTGGTTLVPDDLEESFALQYELGFRGNPEPWVSWDLSGFVLDFDDQIGTIGLPGGFSTVGNVGRARHLGVEFAGEIDLFGLMDSLSNRPVATAPGKGGKESASASTASPASWAERFGSLSLFGNMTLLDAEFISGPLDGKTPRFAPDYLIRTGLVYRAPKDRLRVALMGAFVGDAYADDANTTQRSVPAHMVWDLTLQAKVFKEGITLHAGINNLFDEDYYARVRDDGIDPAYGRNYYVGMAFSF